ncbi:MAG: hypothetical protein GXO60_08280 [Epsilonproteobacteria bacterium]|nr:hypothetical protein [Campylobacterota bacterium]
MIYKDLLKKTVEYYDSSLIALILSFVTIPSFWYISHGNISWVVSCTVLWALGVFMIFQPMIRYIFPYLITQVGTISLTFILAIISIFLNTTVIMLLLPQEDIKIVLNNTLFSSSISNLFIFLWFYIIIAGTLLSGLNFYMKIKPTNILSKLSSKLVMPKNMFVYFTEIGLVFILPIALLFWTDITYSFRVLLGIISIGTGLMIYIHRLNIENSNIRLSAIAIYSAMVLMVNGIVIGSVGLDRIPDTNIKARIAQNKVMLDLAAKDIKYPTFQLNKNPKNGTTTVYQILASIPQIGLHIGHKVATIPNRAIVIKSTDTHYTISDQYNNKRLITLDR